MDKIKINELKIPCNIGVSKEERKIEQEILLNVTLFLDLSRACETDNISYTVDYYSLSRAIRNELKGNSFSLLEKLANSVSNICLAEDRVKSVRVSAIKPEALKEARNAEVEIFRKDE